MNSTLSLTAMLSVGNTQHVHLCVTKKTLDSQFPKPNLRSSAAMYLLHGNTAGAGQHRLIRSAPSRPADVAVAQNDLPPSCATGPGPVAHPASRSMTSPAPSVTVMIRPAADETITRDG